MTETEHSGVPEAIPGSVEAVSVRLGRSEFGIGIESVREVLHVPPITRLPFPPPSVLGVVSVRGAVLPVVDLGDRLFGVPAVRDGRLVIVRDPQSKSDIALLVDGVSDLVSLAGESHDPPPEVQASLPSGWIGAVVAPAPDRLVTLLNLGPILARDRSADEHSR